VRKVLLFLGCTAVLSVPAVAVAGDSSAGKTETARAKSDASNPASTCKSERIGSDFASSHNGRTFSQFYGTNGGKGRGAGANAFGKCVSTIARHQAENGRNSSAESPDKHSAEKQDKDSGEHNSGEDNGSNGAESHVNGGADPAMTCKAMQTNHASQFQTAYGTLPNAFGKCVSSHATSTDG
jgi:hypothetical protein